MIFKRRNPRTTLRIVAEFIWPRGGWRRAATYVLHRMRRLPDTPERICIGIAAGSFVSFLPLYGLHFLSAALVAWVLRGNILAALLGTFYGNPVTFPIMAVSALELGHWLLGNGTMVTFTGRDPARHRLGQRRVHAQSAVVLHRRRGALGRGWPRCSSDVYLPYFAGRRDHRRTFGGGDLLHPPAAGSAPIRTCRAKRLKHRFEAARERQRAATTGEPT